MIAVPRLHDSPNTAMNFSFRTATPLELAGALQDARDYTLMLFDCFAEAGLDAAARVRGAGATLVASGNAAAKLLDAAYVLPVPKPPLPLLSPLLSVVPGQLLAWALAQAKGLDPDRPTGLSKITHAL